MNVFVLLWGYDVKNPYSKTYNYMCIQNAQYINVRIHVYVLVHISYVCMYVCTGFAFNFYPKHVTRGNHTINLQWPYQTCTTVVQTHCYSQLITANRLSAKGLWL